MKCTNCNYESENDFMFCPNCGTQQQAPAQPVQPEQPQQFVQQQPQQFTQQQPQQFQQQQQFGGQPGYTPYQAPQPQPLFYGNGNERILAFFKDTLFLVVAILFSVYSVFNILKLPVIEILFTVFFWIIFVNARKNAVTSNHVKWVSGTTFAKVILNYVAAGAILVAGIAAMGLTAAAGSALGGYSRQYAGVGAAAGSIGIIILVACIIAAGISVLITVLGIRPIQKLIQSCYKSLEMGSLHLEKAGSAKIWLMIFGILKVLGAIGSLISGAALTGAMGVAMNQLSSRIPIPMSVFGFSTGVDILGFIANASLAAAYIMLAIMFGKYFGDIAQAQKMQGQMQQPQQQQQQQF